MAKTERYANGASSGCSQLIPRDCDQSCRERTNGSPGSLTKELNLSQVQRVQTRKILDDGQEESLRLWNDQQLAPIDRMVKLRSVREDAQKKFRALLTKEQQAKYNQIYNREVQAYSLPSSKGSMTASKSN